MPFTGKYESGGDSSDEDMIDEELAASYRLLYTKWEESFMTIEHHKKTTSVLHKENDKLVSTIIGLEEEITKLNSKLEYMIKYLRMLNSESDMLAKILEIGENKVIEFTTFP